MGAEIRSDGSIYSLSSSSGKPVIFDFISAQSPAKEISGAIQIHEDLYRTRKDQLLSRMQSLIGLNQTKIHGRKTSVKPIDKQTARNFVNANHLMGFGGGKLFLGLYAADNLVAVAVFSKPLFMKYETPSYYSSELERFCSLKGSTVVGGMDKLVKHFITTCKTDDLVTYVDKNWSDGKAFQRIGFKLVDETPPLTFFIRSNNYERTVYTSEGGPKNNGYLIQNKGNLKFRLKVNNL